MAFEDILRIAIILLPLALVFYVKNRSVYLTLLMAGSLVIWAMGGVLNFGLIADYGAMLFAISLLGGIISLAMKSAGQGPSPGKMARKTPFLRHFIPSKKSGLEGINSAIKFMTGMAQQIAENVENDMPITKEIHEIMGKNGQVALRKGLDSTKKLSREYGLAVLRSVRQLHIFAANLEKNIKSVKRRKDTDFPDIKRMKANFNNYEDLIRSKIK